MVRRPLPPPPASDALGLFRAAVPPRALPACVEHLLAWMPDAAEREARHAGARATLLATSGAVTRPDFERIAVCDLVELYRWYDDAAFGGCLSRRIADLGHEQVHFRFSNRMRSSGGLTRRRRVRLPDGTVAPQLEVAISLPVLWGAFAGPTDNDDDPPIVVGLPCRDRLDVLLRILEHELIHAFEFLVLGDSSCSAAPFRAVAHGLFGHRESTHRVVPAHRRVAQAYGFRPGDCVRFDFRGEMIEGVVNRVTRRATVLVEDTAGDPYENGRRYRKYYVPLPALERMSPPQMISRRGDHRDG